MRNNTANALASGLDGRRRAAYIVLAYMRVHTIGTGGVAVVMEIMERRELWIHTHFVTDCVRLSHAQGRDIEAALLPVLRQHHIVYGIHLVN